MTNEQDERTLERIRQARRVMLAVPKGRFNMGFWTRSSSCGTTHCVGGWLRLDEWFQKNTPITDIFVFRDGWVFPSKWSLNEELPIILAGAMEIRTSEAKILFGLPVGNPDAPETIEGVLRYLDKLERRYSGESHE